MATSFCPSRWTDTESSTSNILTKSLTSVSFFYFHRNCPELWMCPLWVIKSHPDNEMLFYKNSAGVYSLVMSKHSDADIKLLFFSFSDIMHLFFYFWFWKEWWTLARRLHFWGIMQELWFFAQICHLSVLIGFRFYGHILFSKKIDAWYADLFVSFNLSEWEMVQYICRDWCWCTPIRPGTVNTSYMLCEQILQIQFTAPSTAAHCWFCCCWKVEDTD